MLAPNVKTLGTIVPEKSLPKHIVEKEKWTHKGNDKHEEADYVLQDTSSSTQCLY